MALGLIQTGRFALDIGGSHVIALSATSKSDGLRLRECHDWTISPGLIVDGEIIDPDLFARELKTWVNRHKFRGRGVHLAVSNQKVIVRNIDMPDLPENELAGAVRFQAQEYIPIPVDEVVLDSLLLGRRTEADGTTRQEVLLVAAQKTMIMNLLTAVRRSGLKVLGIDVSSLALLRALIADSPFLPDPDAGPVCDAVIDISSSVSTLAVAVDGIMKFTRIINFSSERFGRSLAETHGIPIEDAQALVNHVGLAGPLAPDADFYREDVVEEAQITLAKIAAELGDELKRSFDYYQAQQHAVPVTRLILSGRGALVRNLDTRLAELLALPVSMADPLTHVVDNSSSMADEALVAMAPSLSVAVGLVLPESD